MTDEANTVSVGGATRQRRITHVATGAAAIDAAGATGRGRLAVGMGFSAGESALSLGYGAPVGERFHFSFGATASGSSTSGGIGFGVDL